MQYQHEPITASQAEIDRRVRYWRDVVTSNEQRLMELGNRTYDDQVDAARYAYDAAFKRHKLSNIIESDANPTEHLQRALAAKALAMALTSLARLGRARCDVLCAALGCLGAIGRGVALAMEHNYGSTLRGALIELR